MKQLRVTSATVRKRLERKQRLEAALAGYKVTRHTASLAIGSRWGSNYGKLEYLSVRPDGVAINRHSSQRSAWQQCWEMLQYRLKVTGAP